MGKKENPTTPISSSNSIQTVTDIQNIQNEQRNQAMAVAVATRGPQLMPAVAAAQAAAVVIRYDFWFEMRVLEVLKRLLLLKINASIDLTWRRKALRALRGIVKLQALDKGVHLVRKQAKATLTMYAGFGDSTSSERVLNGSEWCPKESLIQINQLLEMSWKWKMTCSGKYIMSVP
ncbi:unnamed protein product [Vicia faba]|uniref:Uncharacterized protein n=1 Tax=Vicia faba TaxID=3906 RepID=A0AAV0YIU8_VICFA|nr:unnamed protein product [Vicia faba]